MRVVSSILIALVAASAAHLLYWNATIELTRSVESFGTPVPSLLLIAGAAVLVGIAALTVALSSVGVLVLAAVHLVAAIVTMTVPYSVMPYGPLATLVGDGMRDAVFASTIYWADGAGLLVGAVFLGVGLAGMRRTHSAGVVARAVSVPIALVLAIGGLGATIVGGWTLYREHFQLMSTAVDPVAGALIVVGSLLAAAAAFSARLSALGPTVAGAAIVAIGVVGLSGVARDAVLGLGREIGVSLLASGAIGEPLLIGAAMLLGGAGAGIRARRRTRTSISA